ncbi:hypothetical protein J5X84_24985 [Streptosporangiaceae bacterium NEAU-GS5]|nr:hypothetical protein [Streptosporangiaceae bacterium NEAU-GS5]
MVDFAEGVRRRVREARDALRLARESGDTYGAQAYAADLEEMLRLAEEHGVAIEHAADLAAETQPDSGQVG